MKNADFAANPFTVTGEELLDAIGSWDLVVDVDCFLDFLEEQCLLEDFGWDVMDFFSYDDPKEDLRDPDFYEKRMANLTWGDFLKRDYSGRTVIELEDYFLSEAPDWANTVDEVSREFFIKKLIEAVEKTVAEADFSGCEDWEEEWAREAWAELLENLETAPEDFSFVFSEPKRWADKKVLSEAAAREYFTEVCRAINAAEEAAGRVFAYVNANLSGEIYGFYCAEEEEEELESEEVLRERIEAFEREWAEWDEELASLEDRYAAHNVAGEPIYDLMRIEDRYYEETERIDKALDEARRQLRLVA